MKKPVLISIIAAASTLVIGGVAAFLIINGGITGRFSDRAGTDAAIYENGDARTGNASIPTAQGVLAGATIVNPGPQNATWDASMEYAINVPDSVFKSYGPATVTIGNVTYWNRHGNRGGVPGPTINTRDGQPGYDPGYQRTNFIGILDGTGVFIPAPDYNVWQVLESDGFVGRVGCQEGTSIFVTSEQMDRNYSSSTMPYTILNGKVWFICFDGNAMAVTSGYYRDDKTDYMLPEKVYIVGVDPHSSEDEKPSADFRELPGVKVSLNGDYPGENYYQQYRVVMCAEGGLIYIINYNVSDQSNLTVYIYDPESNSLTSQTVTTDSFGEKIRIDSGFVVENGCIYTVYREGETQVFEGSYSSAECYQKLGIVKYDLSQGIWEKCPEFGVRTYHWYAEYENYRDEDYKCNQYGFDYEYDGTLCKNDDGIFFGSDTGIVFRRRGESSVQVMYENQKVGEYYDSFECTEWNVSDGWIYYAGQYGRFDSKEGGGNRSDFLVYRINYNTGEKQTLCYYDLLVNGPLTQPGWDTSKTLADGVYDSVAKDFVCNVQGNITTIAAYDNRMSIKALVVTVHDDGSMTFTYKDDDNNDAQLEIGVYQ